MKKFLAIVALATVLPASAMAQLDDGQVQQAQLVGQCLVNTAGNPEYVLFHTLINALIANDTETAQGYLPAVIGQAHDNAVANCNQADDWFSQPWAGVALGNYIQGMMTSVFSQMMELLQTLQL